MFDNPDLERWDFPDSTSFELVLGPAILVELDELKVNHRNPNVREKAEGLLIDCDDAPGIELTHKGALTWPSGPRDFGLSLDRRPKPSDDRQRPTSSDTGVNISRPGDGDDDGSAHHPRQLRKDTFEIERFLLSS